MTPAVAVFAGFLAVAAWFDWRQRRVPNWLVGPFALAGFCFQAVEGHVWHGASGAGCAWLLTAIPVWLRGMGMGDQKLLMAAGVWLGPAEVYRLFLLSIVVCLAVAACMPWKRVRVAAKHMRVLAAGWFAHRAVWLPARQESALAIPYAVCLFLAWDLGFAEG